MNPKDIPGVRDGNEPAYAPGIGKAADEVGLNASAEQLLIEKVMALPPERRAEVEDFVDFLQGRVTEQRLVEEVTKSSDPAFRVIWDNDEDAAYDRL